MKPSQKTNLALLAFTSGWVLTDICRNHEFITKNNMSAHHAAKWEYPGYGNPAWNTLRALPRIALDRRNSVAPELVPLPDDVISEVKAALLEAVKQIQVEKPS